VAALGNSPPEREAKLAVARALAGVAAGCGEIEGIEAADDRGFFGNLFS